MKGKCIECAEHNSSRIHFMRRLLFRDRHDDATGFRPVSSSWRARVREFFRGVAPLHFLTDLAYTALYLSICVLECIAAHNEKRVTGMTTPIRALSRNSAAIAQAERYRDQIERGGCTFKHSGTQQVRLQLFRAVHCKSVSA